MIHLYRCDSIIQTCQNPLKLLNVSPLFLDPIEILLILKNIQGSVFTSPFGKDVLLSQLMCYSWCASKPVISPSLATGSPGRVAFHSFITRSYLTEGPSF